MAKYPNTTISPMCIPLNSKCFSKNYALKTQTCTLTQERFQKPVCLFKKFNVNSNNSNEWTDVHAFSSFECDELIRGLEATWGKHQTQNLYDYDINSSEVRNFSCKNLGFEYLLVPNRILWQAKGVMSLPALPTRGEPPTFDELKINLKQHKIKIYEDGDELSNAIPCMHKEGMSTQVWTDLYAEKWVFNSHGKFYKFRNCLFEECVFRNICWCQISFIACKFKNCTWINCLPKARKEDEHMYNCIYEKCVIISTTSPSYYGRDDTADEMKELLLGVSTGQLMQKNSKNIKVVSFNNEDEDDDDGDNDENNNNEDDDNNGDNDNNNEDDDVDDEDVESISNNFDIE
jgi:hypothetical protein